MSHELASDVEQQLQSFLASGDYATEADVMRAALLALGREKNEIAAIQQGVDDVEAGRFRSLDEVDADLRRKYRFPEDQ